MLRLEAEGVLVETLGGTKAGMVDIGRRSSVYMSNKISDNPTVATGWSAKWLKAASKFSSAVYGED